MISWKKLVVLKLAGFLLFCSPCLHNKVYLVLQKGFYLRIGFSHKVKPKSKTNHLDQSGMKEPSNF